MVSRLQLLLVFASAVILGSKSRETPDHMLLSQTRHLINVEGQVPHIYICLEPHLGLMIRYLLLFDNYGLVFVGRPL
jgi:hypothetical protein